MRNALKALGAILAVIALCAPLMFLPAEDTQPAALGYAGVTVTVPPTVVVATTIPGLETTTTTTEPRTEPTPSTSTSSTTTTTAPVEITIAAVGGLFVSPEIMGSVHNPASNSYDFGPILAPVAPYLAKADYAVANLGPRLAGPEAGYESPSGANAPRELAFALKSAGVDLVGTANPGSLGLGWEGVTGTLDRLDAAGLAHAGTSRTAAERNTPVIADVKGVKVAFLDYTTSVAGPLPDGQQKDFAVNTLDLATVTHDASTARSWGADVVLAMIDYGTGYEVQPSQEQKSLANGILSHGVDVILGCRAGVIQTIGPFYPFIRANATYVAYSLGDFLANPTKQTSTGTSLQTAPQAGMVVYLHFQKRGLRTYATGVNYLPLYVQKATHEAAGTDKTTTTAGSAAAKVITFRILPVLPGLEPHTDVPLREADRAQMTAIWNYARDQLYRPDEDITPLAPSQLGL